MTDLKVYLASPPDLEDLVAEVWSDEHLVAEIRRADGGALVASIWLGEDQVPVEMALSDLMKALEVARHALQSER